MSTILYMIDTMGRVNLGNVGWVVYIYPISLVPQRASHMEVIYLRHMYIYHRPRSIVRARNIIRRQTL